MAAYERMLQDQLMAGDSLDQVDLDELLRRLSDDDLRKREAAGAEIFGRALSGRALVEELRALRLLDVEARFRLRVILRGPCRYFVRVTSVTAAFGSAAWNRVAQLRFGSAPDHIRVTTPEYTLGNNTRLGPGGGLQVYNSKDDGHEVLRCGAWVRHALYVEVVDEIATTEVFGFRCVTGVLLQEVTLRERRWRFTKAHGFERARLNFDVNVEIERQCGWDAWHG